jgi:hypothetical protein
MRWAVHSWPKLTYQTTRSGKIWGDMRKYESAQPTKHTLKFHSDVVILDSLFPRNIYDILINQTDVHLFSLRLVSIMHVVLEKI